MREISIDLSHRQSNPTVFAGYEGEHNATQVTVVLPIEMANSKEITTFYPRFCTSCREDYVGETIANTGNQKIIFKVHQAITRRGKAEIQIEGKDSEGNIIARSALGYLVFNPSVNNQGEELGLVVNDAEELTRAKEELQELIDEASELLGEANLSNYYTKTETDQALTEKANKSELPQKVSDLENDSGYITEEDIKGKYENKILEYLTYEIFDGKVTITDCDTSISGSHIIPDTIEGHIVTAIGESAFLECRLLESIIVPDNVTQIGYQAFFNCSNLTSIIIPDGVTSIKNAVFWGCNSLTSVTIPLGIISISNSAFNGCDALADVYFGGTKEQWYAIEIDSGNDPLDNATIRFANMYETYSKTETDELLSIKADKSQYIMFSDGDTITLVDNTTYYTEGTISNLTIIYPSESFICSLEFTLATTGNITITLPESKYIGGTPTFANGETWELNIKNGVVVGGLVE